MFWATNRLLNCSMIARTGCWSKVSCFRMNKTISWTDSYSIKTDWPVSFSDSCCPIRLPIIMLRSTEDFLLPRIWSRGIEFIARLTFVWFWKSKKFSFHYVSRDAWPDFFSMYASKDSRHLSTIQKLDKSSSSWGDLLENFGRVKLRLLVFNCLLVGLSKAVDYRKYLILNRQQTSGTGVLHCWQHISSISRSIRSALSMLLLRTISYISVILRCSVVFFCAS